jgi:predicted flap endonuclease-1-like 5' DNA nuclease
MNRTGSTNVSLTFCAVIGLFLGALVTGLLMVVGDWDFLPAAAVGCLFLILAILLLPLIFIKRDGTDVPYGAPVTGDEAGSAPTAAESAAHTMAEPAPTASASAGAATSSAAAATAAPTSAPAAAVTPSAALAGEAELAGRKGEWKYEGDADADAKAKADAAAAKAAADAKAKADAAAAKAAADKAAAEKAAAEKAGAMDYDGDGVVEGANEGTRPEALDGPRGGKADDLKQIKGVGPKMEKLCNSLGFYHFDQIASWTPDEVAWVDANLEGFKGRVTRDTWVDQAKVLAEGGTTEFSKKVKKGGVY